MTLVSPPTVSVVIPCHNAAAWIGETVRSAATQEGVSFEVILVDDGSTDDSVERAVAEANGSLTVIRQAQSGVSRARNAGTLAARGVFVQYLDADDVLRPGTLRQRADALMETGADVAYCDWVRLHSQHDGSFREGAPVRRALSSRPDVDLLGDFWWPPGAVLYRRTLVDALLPWREDLPVIQDARFLLDAALAGARFVHVGGVGLAYREHAASLSRRDPRAFLEDCFRSGSELHAGWERAGTLDAERRRVLGNLYSFLTRSFFRIDRARFADVLARARQLDPAFAPDRPRALRLVSSVIGYPAAEHVASVWRGVKHLSASWRWYPRT